MYHTHLAVRYLELVLSLRNSANADKNQLDQARSVTFCQLLLYYFISPPENDSFWKDFCFAVVFFSFFFFRRIISELRQPIGAKFCTMLGAAFNFIISIRNFGGASPKNF